MLIVENLHKTYPTPQGPLPVLRGASLSLAAGGTLAMMGDSGSGKSTLLHLVAGLDAADSGTIRLGQTEITALGDAGRASLRRSRIGVVFQQFNLISSLTVAANLAFQARLAGRYDAAWQSELTERLGLADVGARYPEQLSGGQQQRVAIGRALAARPELLLADEPTGNLDAETGDTVMRLTLDLVASSGCALLMVTHSARIAGMLSQQVRLEHGQLAA
jgi:putative ABC transport system ATP-binding protein